ncbi:probable caffeoyl-CoA O-methyltransferase At4g26220 isoform X2 [Telopea speciosissima]|uniref:probable caffeoyl-CoA O-methyltransferase At4g26220 isoform X2 n=1 Tax=Telopea speciosissima TaxID=54955 RepID=UPI001CC37989|nr:probable caffeoyl-CoA O-methyltransferase At4g26220 isoform X2 [Telopea speciosissima]
MEEDHENRESSKTNKGLLQTDELYQYILETSVYPREAEPLKEIRDATANHPRRLMATAPDAGLLLSLLLKLVDAKNTIEIGVFTGYSLLLTALSIPADGKSDKEDSFDYVYVDADKDNYGNYHERLMKLVRVGGIIIYDNTLWGGTVALPKSIVPEHRTYHREHIIEFNKLLSNDPRIQISQIPLGDGVTICRRIY